MSDWMQLGIARRTDALQAAVRSWGEPGPRHTVELHAQFVTFLAEAFDMFLITGAVHGVKTAEPEPAHPDQQGTIIPVIEAATAWVDHAHENNPAGPENWRHWADNHDIALINAVRAMRGQQPLEGKDDDAANG